MNMDPIAGRTCGSCTLCCRLPEIGQLDKPANVWCSYCLPGQGCSIYDRRPAPCRDFLCLWRTSPQLKPHWDPAVSRMMIYVQGPQTTVLVDPDFAEIWQRSPYAEELAHLAREAEASGGYVILFVGDDVFKIEPAPDAGPESEGRHERLAAAACAG